MSQADRCFSHFLQAIDDLIDRASSAQSSYKGYFHDGNYDDDYSETKGDRERLFNIKQNLIQMYALNRHQIESARAVRDIVHQYLQEEIIGPEACATEALKSCAYQIQCCVHHSYRVYPWDVVRYFYQKFQRKHNERIGGF